jgi:hypothetical protein
LLPHRTGQPNGAATSLADLGSAQDRTADPAEEQHQWGSHRKEKRVSDSKERTDQGAMARKAWATRELGLAAPDHPSAGEHGGDGLKSTPRPDYPPSGAFDAEGHRPVLERSRKER